MKELRMGLLNVIILNKILKFKVRTGLRSLRSCVQNFRCLSTYGFFSKSSYEYVDNMK
jgi:hypothetical protein